MNRMTCLPLCCILMVCVVSLPVNAAEVQTTRLVISEDTLVSPLATGSFHVVIPAGTNAVGDTVFPLAAGETVTFKASYSPFSASVDVGLIAPDGKFYCFNITGGSIDKTMQVSKSGDYKLQIRNNSSEEVEVSGFVNY